MAQTAEHNRKIESGEIKRDTLEDYCKTEREWIKRGDGVHPAILAVSFINVFIWRHGPGDIKTIDLLLDGLIQLKRESKLAEDLDFCQTQIDAYKILRLFVLQERIC